MEKYCEVKETIYKTKQNKKRSLQVHGFIFEFLSFSVGLYLCFSFWLTSRCIIGSGFIHVIRTDSNVFFFFLCLI